MSEKNEQELSKDEALKNTAESAMASKDHGQRRKRRGCH